MKTRFINKIYFSGHRETNAEGQNNTDSVDTLKSGTRDSSKISMSDNVVEVLDLSVNISDSNSNNNPAVSRSMYVSW